MVFLLAFSDYFSGFHTLVVENSNIKKKIAVMYCNNNNNIYIISMEGDGKKTKRGLVISFSYDFQLSLALEAACFALLQK